MLNHLLTSVESILNHPNWITAIADIIIDKAMSQKTATAGEFCGCTPDCKKKEQVCEWVWIGTWYWYCSSPCQATGAPCPPGIPC